MSEKIPGEESKPEPCSGCRLWLADGWTVAGLWTENVWRAEVQGPQGPAGEVSTQQLNEAIATTARNPNGLAPFGGGFSDPPTQAELEAFASYVESLRAALVR